MPTSGIDGVSQFDQHNWLVHLVNTAGSTSSVFLGGHSAIIVEGLTDDNKIYLAKFDILASNFPGHILRVLSETSAVIGPQKGYVSTVRMMQGIADAADETAVRELYANRKFGHGKSRAWRKTVPEVMHLRSEVLQDQLRTARSIAVAFIEAENAKNHAYFQAVDLLDNVSVTVSENEQEVKRRPFHPIRQGQTSIAMFLSYAEALKTDLDSDQHILIKKSQAETFLRLMTGRHLRNFLSKNLEQMKVDGFLGGDHLSQLIAFRLTGSSATFIDSRSRQERDLTDPVNCTRWCKDKLELIGITELNPKNKPKIAVKENSGCAIL